MLHPHKSITPLDLSGPFLGAALVAPWGEFRTNATSYTRNAAKDSIDAPVLRKWSAYYMGGAKVDNYNQPFRAVAGWWKDLHGVVQNVIVTAGTDEVLLDDIQAFADTLKVSRYLAARQYVDFELRKFSQVRRSWSLGSGKSMISLS